MPLPAYPDRAVAVGEVQGLAVGRTSRWQASGPIKAIFENVSKELVARYVACPSSPVNWSSEPSADRATRWRSTGRPRAVGHGRAYYAG